MAGAGVCEVGWSEYERPCPENHECIAKLDTPHREYIAMELCVELAHNQSDPGMGRDGMVSRELVETGSRKPYG
jgi:hypothetical protein